MKTHNTPPADPFADWMPGRNWLELGQPLTPTMEREATMNRIIREYQLPWRIDGDYIVNAEGLAVCEWRNPAFSSDAEQLHAERIVAAVNSTYSLSNDQMKAVINTEFGAIAV